MTFTDDLKKTAKKSGIDLEDKSAGRFVHEDDSLLFSEAIDNNLEILDIKQAMAKYDWVKDYFWKAVDKNKDEFTKLVDKELDGGYFIRVKKGTTVTFPIQTCMVIRGDNYKQRVHNVIIIEEGAKANILSGCFVHPNVKTSEHIGISEFYVKKNAYLNFTMVHNWTEKTFVRPRSAAIVEDGGNFISNYIILSGVDDLQMYPATKLLGVNSKCTLTSLMYGQGKSKIDVGGRIEAIGEGSRGEVISRAIATDSAEINARGMIIGDNKDSKLHLECQGLLLSENALIKAIPELIAKKEGTDMSHEAAVGKIAEDEIIYLMTRGLSREEATSIIVRGFLDIKILGLPKDFTDKIRPLIDKVGNGM